MNRRRSLQITLVITGLAALLLYPLMHLWPSGWAWSPGQQEYELMIVGIYAILGVFLLLAARKLQGGARRFDPALLRAHLVLGAIHEIGPRLRDERKARIIERRLQRALLARDHGGVCPANHPALPVNPLLQDFPDGE